MKPLRNLAAIPAFKIVQFSLAMALTAAGLATSGPAAAAEEIFLRLDGIAGGATAAGHPNEIALSTYSQAFSNTASATTGSGGVAGKVKCGEIIVTKNIDKSSPKLIGEVVTGNHIPTGDIRFDSTRGNGTLAESYHVALTDIIVTEVSQMDHTPHGVMEQVTLSARQFKFTFTPTTDSGTAGTPISFSVDCGTNQVN
jgi:type VI secretion system secreted protein Hcp